ncbi:uncharacterized protein [Oscarella lobularis]|uniref:uncharacterized protein isoform X2 n=1 Tax=Oscarella lobularis TaxID=121494 RepID=UPI003313D6F3
MIQIVIVTHCVLAFVLCRGKQFVYKAKPMRHEVTNEASQKLFVGERGMATLSYQYRGNNTVAAFTWQTLSPETTIATLTTVASSAVPPYSVAGIVSQAYRTDLIIRSVIASLDGKVYRCFVDFSPASTPRVFSGQVTLTLRDVPELFVLSPSDENVIVNISKPFVIRINVTQGDDVVNVNLTKDGDLVQLNGMGKLYEHNIPQVKASTNGTYIAIGDNDVGYHQVSFKLLAFYLDNAECSVVANSMVHGTVICTIKSFPPVEKATYSCENQRVDLTWKEIGSADMLGVSKYQANASISSTDVPIFNGTCRLTTANVYGQFNETLNEVLLSTPTPPPRPTTDGFRTMTGLSSDTVGIQSTFLPTQSAETCSRTGLFAAVGVMAVLLVLVGGHGSTKSEFREKPKMLKCKAAHCMHRQRMFAIKFTQRLKHHQSMPQFPRLRADVSQAGHSTKAAEMNPFLFVCNFHGW